MFSGRLPGSWKQWLRWGLVAVLIVTCVTLAVVWMMLQHIPVWYLPATVSNEDLPSVRRDSSRWVDKVGDKMVRRRTFEIELEEAEFNRLLAARSDIMPDVGRFIPREVVEPVVRFENGHVRVGARLVQERWECIVSLGLSIEVSEDGRHLLFELHEVRAGSLLLSDDILQRVFGPLLEDARQSALRDRSSGAWSQAFREVDHVSKLFAGVLIRNRFVWPNGHRRFRIESISVGNGVLRAVIDPF